MILILNVLFDKHWRSLIFRNCIPWKPGFSKIVSKGHARSLISIEIIGCLFWLRIILNY